MHSPDLSRFAVFRLGLAQLIIWGTTFYLPGAFGNAIAADLGWSGQRVFSGLSVALLVMGFVSPAVSWLILRLGARQVLQLGSVLAASGCCVLALCETFLSGFSAGPCWASACVCRFTTHYLPRWPG